MTFQFLNRIFSLPLAGVFAAASTTGPGVGGSEWVANLRDFTCVSYIHPAVIYLHRGDYFQYIFTNIRIFFLSFHIVHVYVSTGPV